MKARKKTLSRSTILLCCLGTQLLGQTGSPSKQVLALDRGWEFRQQGAPAGAPAAAWLSASVPGDVHLDLLHHGLIPDPFNRDNESGLQWISKAGWEYQTSVEAPPELLQRRNIELVFEGLDAACEVYINGRLVLAGDNMFRVWRVDAKPWLRAGANVILVVFPPQDQAAEKVAAADPWLARTQVPAKNYIRKAAYEHGWDWGPTFVTSGIWRPARIEAWDDARISDFHIRQRDIAAAVAHIDGEVEVTASAEAKAEVSVSYEDASGPVRLLREVALHPGVNHVDFPMEISRPKLWFPTGYGDQPMYAFEAAVKIAGQTVDGRSVRTGLRSVVLRRDVDTWGRSFEFVVNGIPVFAKGADVIPFDSFPNRVTTAAYRRILESAKAANMNMIREWGGGYYETDEFYAICDELGLMVWQEFMFGNEMQPGTYPFKLSVEREAVDQLRRLRDHPSIVLWCGNNETEAAFGWPGRVTVDPPTFLQMWKDYITISSGILGQAVRELSPETPYWPSSPSSDYEATSPSYESGDIHDWSIWHGRKAFATYEDNHFRFVSEYGFQSFPELSTVESYTDAADRAGIFTPVMLAHQKSPSGNALIREYMLRDYPEPKDFASFLYASQVLQAEGVKVAAEHLRCDRPRCMGSLFWQLNDCWPVASWASIDYYGRWKALQYYARRFYAPLLVSPHVSRDRLAVYVVSDLTRPVDASLRIRLFTLDGTILHDEMVPVNVQALSSRIGFESGLDRLAPAGTDTSKVFVAAELAAGDRVVSRNIVYLVPTKKIRLPSAHVSAVAAQDGDSIRIRVASDALARSVALSFGNLNVEPSDNYFDLLPGESVDVQVKGAASLEDVRKNLVIRSLADAFGPNP
jgi:beta-mannosidase